MAQFPMLPLYTDAFMADTAHLSTVEVGAYLLLLMAAWRTRECALPNDERKLQRITKMNNPTWGRSKKTLLAFWQIGDDGLLFQKDCINRGSVQRKLRLAWDHDLRKGVREVENSMDKKICE